jgi:hypothetical protein
MYDVFATGYLVSSNSPWVWMGQGAPGGMYSLSNIGSNAVYLVLGTPLDTDHDGLTDAYERLVSRTDPNNPDSNGDGIPDGWAALLGIGGDISGRQSSRSNYNYDLADWFRGVSGARNGSVTLDNEGNVLTVSQ